MIKLEVKGSEVKGAFHGRGEEILFEAIKLEWTLRKVLKEKDLAAYLTFLSIVDDPDFLDSLEAGSERNNSESKKKDFEDMLKQMMEGLDEEA